MNMVTNTGESPAVGFANATRQSWLSPISFQYGANAIVQQLLPATGFLSRIMLYVTASITTSNAGGDNFSLNVTNPIPDPFRFIQRVRLLSQNGSEIVNASGYGLYLASRISRSNFDIRNPITSLAATNNATAVYSAPSTPAVNTTYVIKYPIEIPVAWGEQLQAGLINMSNLNTRLPLEITFGNAATDLLTIGQGSCTVNSVSVQAVPEIYQVPLDPRNLPDESYICATREEIVPITNTGGFNYHPTIGPIYLDTLQQFENNALRMVPANFTGFNLNYSQTSSPYSNVPPEHMLYMTRKRLGNQDLPDGVFWWGFDQAIGIPEINNTRDAFDTSSLTDIYMQAVIAGTVTLTNAKVRVVNRMLLRRG